MKRSVRKQRKVDAFSLNLYELEKLCTVLQKEFRVPPYPVPQSDNISISIELKFPGETLEFDSVDDIRSNKLPYKKSKEFSIRMYSRAHSFEASKHLILSSGEPSGFDASVTSTCDNEEWCVSVNEVLVFHLRRHRVWYYWIIPSLRWFVTTMLLGFCGAFFAVTSFSEISSPLSQIVAFATFFIIFIPLSFLRRSILSPGTITIEQKHYDIKIIKTISILIGSLAAVITAAITLAKFLLG